MPRPGGACIKALLIQRQPGREGGREPKSIIPTGASRQKLVLLVLRGMSGAESAAPGLQACRPRLAGQTDLNKYIKEFDDRGTYLTIENGHLNQKKQLYNKNDNKKPLSLNLKKTLEKANATPGPGAYETN